MTKQIEGSAALVRLVQDVFHRSRPCHCHGDGKLSERQVLERLVQQRYVQFSDVNQSGFLPIREVLPYSRGHDLERAGVRDLTDLTGWTFARLLRISGFGPVRAAEIEATMAQYGLALRDGDPRRYQHLVVEDEPDAEALSMAGSPEEVRQQCAFEMLDLAKRMTAFSASMMRCALRATAPKKRKQALSGQIRRNIQGAMKLYQGATGIAAVLEEVEAAEAVERKLPVRPDRGIVRDGNVVSGAFPQVAAEAS